MLKTMPPPPPPAAAASGGIPLVARAESSIKDYGLRATRQVKAGTLLFEEAPFVAQRHYNESKGKRRG